MSDDTIIFPVYRKYKNNKSYFKISDKENFQEIKVIGSRYFVSNIKAKLYPEKMFILSLLSVEEAVADPIEAAEYDDIASKAGI